MKLQFLMCTIFFSSGCGLINKEPEKNGFYESISGWDIIHVPIIPPFKATSTYPNIWLIGGSHELIKLNDHTYGDIPVLGFGVSNCYVYGTTPEGYTENIDKWFLFNTSTLDYIEFETEDQLSIKLDSLDIEKLPIKNCNVYYKSLTEGNKCYWFPMNEMNK